MAARSAALGAFRAQVGDARSSLIDPDEQASLAVALLEIARERRLAAVTRPLELLHVDSLASRTVCRRAAAIARRG